MLNKKSAFFSIADVVLVYSPLVVSFWGIFNYPDAKHLWSKVTLISCAYLFLFRFNDWLYEVESKKITLLILISSSAYFFFMQFCNYGNSDLPRALLYASLYFLVLPSSLIRLTVLKYILVVGAFFSGLVSIYEVYVLGVERAGHYVLNPIPVSFNSGLLLILNVWIVFKSYRKAKLLFVLSVLAVLLTLVSVVLTETRASWLALLITFLIYSFHLIFNSTLKYKILFLFIGYVMSISVLWNIPTVNVRVVEAYNQISEYKNNSYNSSTGIRIKLWEAGLDISQESTLIGLSKEEVQHVVNERIVSGEYPDFLSSFLIHPNPNFHNQYIQMLVTSGVLGLMFLMFMILSPVFLVIALGRSDLMLISTLVVVFSLVCLIFDSLFLYNHTLIQYGLVIILFYLLARLDNEKAKNSY